MNKIMKNTIIITAITLIAGIALGFVYEITKAPIAEAQEKAKQEAYETVLPEAKEFELFSDFNADEAVSILNDAGLFGDVIEEVVVGMDGGDVVGYVITTTSKEGYGGDIKISTGILTDGSVKGIDILSISETAGLGMKADEDSFKNQFANKLVDRFAYTKTGEEGDDKIDALSGATITTNAVTNNVNASLEYFKNVIGGSANE